MDGVVVVEHSPAPAAQFLFVGGVALVCSEALFSTPIVLAASGAKISSSPAAVAVKMMPSTSMSSTSSNYINTDLPNPNDEPEISDSHFLKNAINETRRQSQHAERLYRERNPALVADSRRETAQLYQKYRDDEEKKRMEESKSKEVFANTPISRNHDRKRRVAEMDDDWAKRAGGPAWGQPNAYQMHQQAAYQQQQQQQYMLMQQHQQQQRELMAQRSAAAVAAAAIAQPPSFPMRPNYGMMATSSNGVKSEPVTPSTTHHASPITPALKLADDLSDLPTPGNVDFLAESEFRCDNDVIRDLGPDCLEGEDLFADVEAPMFTSTPLPMNEVPQQSAPMQQPQPQPHQNG
ncbi:unnamed protein product [Caenorhabditis bovis]|uniref:Uncharacterized protein n=1 Tax=Caenorhabditis bovis TaxID=2654633 RepID=A0A8S1ETE2_9PELO|nr:unnamed protein product [Caenorhabditis bovis]